MEKVCNDIQFINVNKNFNSLIALDNISLSIAKGSIFGIVGKSGAGKSTLLRTINKLETIDSGTILVKGQDISKLNRQGLRLYRQKVAMIFQSFALLETESVYRNIALPLVCHKKSDVKKRVEELAEIVGLTDKLNCKPKELSGGQKQRVAIARALALNPEIILCDEATSALDPITTTAILELLEKINKEFNITIIIVTHQMEVVKAICSEIAIIKDGRIIEKGKTDEIFLSSNTALKTLVDEEEILPKRGINIKLYFPKSCSSESLITKMARELDIDFSIVWGKLEKFQNDVLGSLIINIDEIHFQNVNQYLLNKAINFEVINSKEETV